MMILARHRPKPAHLPEQPLQHFEAAAQIVWQKPMRFFSKVEQDRAEFKQGNRSPAIHRRMIDHGWYAVIGRNRQKRWTKLLAGCNVPRHQPVRRSRLLQED